MPSQTKHSGLFAHFLIHSLLLGGSISFQVPELLTPYNFHWLMLFPHLAFSLVSNYVNSFFHPLPAWPCIGWLLSALIGYAMVSEASWSDASITKVFDYIWMNGVPHGHPDAYLSITSTEIKQMTDRHWGFCHFLPSPKESHPEDTRAQALPTPSRDPSRCHFISGWWLFLIQFIVCLYLIFFYGFILSILYTQLYDFPLI